MDLFRKLSEVMADGSTLAITVAKKVDTLVVSVLPGTPLVKEPAVKNIVPLNLRGTAEELDEGFLEAILTPVKKTNGLFTDLENFEKAQKAAKDASEMEKKAKEEVKKNSELFSKWMSLAEQNLQEQKYKDAITCAKDALRYADAVSGGKAKAEAFLKKATDASAEGLFGANEDKSDGKNIKLSAKNTAKNTPKTDADEKPDEEDSDEE